MSDAPGGRAALVVAIALPPGLEHIRQRHVDNAPLGVPAHVTVLFPFVAAASIDPDVVDRVGRTVARLRAFDVAFREVQRWDPKPTPEGVIWLAPDPHRPFIALTDALVAEFPDQVPYGGLHDEVIPHLTLATVGGEQFEAIAAEAPRHLPFRRRVRHVSLLVEDDAGRWRTRRRLPLG